MMVAKKQPQATFLMVGDKVLWKGIKLAVSEVLEDGSVVAISPTMRVHVSSPDQLEKYNGG